MKSLSFAVPVVLALFAVACGDASTSNEPSDVPAGPAAETPAKKPAKNDTSTSTPEELPSTNKPADEATAPAAIATAKIRDGVRSFVATNDALFLANDTTVEKTAVDGTGALPLGAFGKTINLATDGTRVYGLVDKGGNFYEVFSTKLDGTEGGHHLNWLKSNGEPNSLALNAGRIFFSTTTTTALSNRILSASATPVTTGNAPYRTEELVDAKTVAPVFTDGRLYAVDHVRQSAVRVSLTDATETVDFIQDKLPLSAGGIALQGTDVYTRTAKGIVRAPSTAASNATATVVVPSAACPIFDEATGAESILDDAIVVDGTTIYAACRAGGNVEVRAFALDGKLAKTVASVPYGAGLSHLRVTATAAYWLTRPTATTTELWRSAK